MAEQEIVSPGEFLPVFASVFKFVLFRYNISFVNYGEWLPRSNISSNSPRSAESINDKCTYIMYIYETPNSLK